MMRRDYILLGATALTCLLIGAVYMWGVKDLARIQGDTAVLRTEIANARLLQMRTHATRSESEQLAQNETAVYAHFVQPEDVVSFLQYIEKTGAAYDTVVNVVSVSDTAASGTIVVSLSIEGTFSALTKVLGTLEYGPYAIGTKTVTLDKQDEGSWRLTGSFTALTHTP